MSANYAVNVYDFDHTIFHGDASFYFIRYCLLRNPRLWKYLPSYAVVLLLYMLGRRTRKEVKEVAFAFLQDLIDVDQTVNNYWSKYAGNIEPWYQLQHEDSDIIISASPEFLLAPIAKRLGVSSLIATRMDKHSGRIEGENCRGEEKLRRLHSFNPNVIINKFYSDSHSDLPLFDLAKEPYFVSRRKIIVYKRITTPKN